MIFFFFFRLQSDAFISIQYPWSFQQSLYYLSEMFNLYCLEIVYNPKSRTSVGTGSESLNVKCE